MKGIQPELMKILEDPKIRQNVDLYTVARYHNLGKTGEVQEKSELLEGLVFNIMPKSALHTNIIRLTAKLLNKFLPAGFLLSQEAPITIEAIDSEPEPDIMICKGSEADFWENNPTTAELVVEIAVSSVNLNRYKARLYATAGVREYWIVLVDERKLEILSKPENGKYTESRIVNDQVESQVFSEVVFPLAEILPPLKK